MTGTHSPGMKHACTLTAVALDTLTEGAANTESLITAAANTVNDEHPVTVITGQAHLSAFLVTALAEKLKCTPEEALAEISTRLSDVAQLNP